MAKPPVHRIKPATNKVFDKTTKKTTEIFEKGETNIDAKKAAIREYRRKASRMASKANKRIERLEKNQKTMSPAYQKYVVNGEPRFGIRGKSYNEVQAMVSKMEGFLAAQTSTMTGIKEWSTNIADLTGFQYDDYEALQKHVGGFFDLYNKSEQLLRHIDDLGSAFDSEQIMDTIRTYVKTEQIDLSDIESSIDMMAEMVTEALKEYEDNSPIIEGWYSLKKSNVDDSNH